MKTELEREHLVITTIRSNVVDINPETGAISIACPKLPKDMDARIGVRRNPQNPDKKEKIFGYNAVLSTSLELQLRLELPVAVSCIAGNAEEGDMLIANRERMRHHHVCEVKIDIADSKFDATKNYEYIRGEGSIPIIDYNPRNENLSKEALLKRGYDQNGWPFAPCALLCRPNGFDNDRQRLTFCCFKHCFTLKHKALETLQNRFDIASCPHLGNRTGFVKHMTLQDHPRLINEIPRGPQRYKQIKKLRAASERSNSTMKEDLKILDKPRVIASGRAGVLVLLAAIFLLCKRGFGFIARVTHLLRRFRQTRDPKLEKLLKQPEIPKSIRNLIQRE